jgi:hypothetical protein
MIKQDARQIATIALIENSLRFKIHIKTGKDAVAATELSDT